MIVRRLKSILVIPVMAAIAILCGFLAWTQHAAREHPNTVLEMDPGQVEALLSVAESARLDGLGETELVYELGRRVLRRAPLLDAPLVYAGTREAQAGNEDAARVAFAHALNQQPRNVPALSWLASDAVRNGRFDEALQHLSRLPELAPDAGWLYADIVATFSASPEGLRTFESALAARTPLAEAALDRLTDTSNDIPLLVRLNGESAKGQALLVQRLYRERGPLEAFLAWTSMASSAEVRALTWPNDPAFLGSSVPPPFSWKTQEGAQILKEGGLYGRYSGRGVPTLAQQVMLLGQGRYSLHSEMDGKVEQQGGSFEWRISCVAGNRQLGVIAIKNLSDTISRDSVSFEVPGGDDCAAQLLALVGRPGELLRPARATFRHLTIESRDGL
jgi:hypothetical protein